MPCELPIPRTFWQAEESRCSRLEPAGEEGGASWEDRVSGPVWMLPFALLVFRVGLDHPVPDLQFWPCSRHRLAVRSPVSSTEGHPVP